MSQTQQQAPVKAPLMPPSASLDATSAPARPLTFEDVERLADTNPEAARQWLELQEKLEAARTKRNTRSQEANFAMAMLKQVESSMLATARHQAACESQGHVREDGSLAIGGQKDSTGLFHGVCCVCKKLWQRGIGNSPGQLPPHFANRLNSELIGG